MYRKKDLIRDLSEDLDITLKQSEEIYEKAISLITSKLIDDEDVDLYGLGRLEVKNRKSSYRHNDEIIKITTKSVNFKTSKTLKDALKK